MKNNKGFSLVELIIVIAIMAILVGVMAPQLIKYIEKTNVSADTQLADSVKTAITTTIMDPAVINKNGAQVASTQAVTAWANITTLPGTSGDALTVKGGVEEILGYTVASATTKLKSSAKSNNGVIEFKMVDGNTVAVAVTNSDVTGKKKSGQSSLYIVVGADTY